MKYFARSWVPVETKSGRKNNYAKEGRFDFAWMILYIVMTTLIAMGFFPDRYSNYDIPLIMFKNITLVGISEAWVVLGITTIQAIDRAHDFAQMRGKMRKAIVITNIETRQD